MTETINYRKQFWIDLRKSDWAKKVEERMDDLFFKILTERETEKDN